MIRSSRWVVVALLLGLALRLGAHVFLRATPPAGDELEYSARAAALVEGRTLLGEGKRPPGSIWASAAFQRLTGLGGPEARLMNVLAGCGVIALVWVLGMRAGGGRVAAIAAFATALYPVLILYDVSQWSEPLYSVLLFGAVALLARRAGAAAAVGAGALMGAAALTREVGVILPALGGVALLGGGGWRDRRAWARAALLVAGFLAVLAPWTIRQNRGDGPFTLVSRTSGLNLYIGNAPPPEDLEGPVRRGGGLKMVRAYERLGPDRETREAAAKEIALRAIRARMPAWPLEKIGETMPALLTPSPLCYPRLRHRSTEPGWSGRWAYRTPVDGTRIEWLRDALAFAAVAAWLAAALAGTAGLVLAGGRPVFRLLLAVVALHVIPVLITFAVSRFRMPFVPVLLIGAAWLAVHGRAAWRAASLRRRVAVVVATALVAAAIGAGWNELVDPRWA